MTFRERVKRLRRLMVVQLLAQDPDNGHNIYILRSALADLAQNVTASEMASLADWLAAAGLVTFLTRDPPPVLRVTDQGLALAAGRIAVRGVARPTP